MAGPRPHDGPAVNGVIASRPALRRRGVLAQMALVLVAALTVQVILPFRGDSTAHVVGGAALAMGIGVVLPSRWIHESTALTEALTFAAITIVAWAAESTIIGPFDLLDIAFGLAGSFVALAALPCWADLDRTGRVRLGVGAITLMSVAITWRYGLRIGH